MTRPPDEPQPLHFLSGGGLCGEIVRSVDWSKSPLGPPGSWPGGLQTTVGILLHSRHPMFVWWGEELIQFYNDGYLPSFGVGKHPEAMGQRGRDCWQEIWPIIGPQIDDVMLRGKASWNEDQLVPIFRNGHIEEVYWTYGYSPIYDQGKVGGTLVVCTETTARVVAERRLGVIRSLTLGLAAACTPAEVTSAAVAVLTRADRDVPFALVRGAHEPIGVGLDEATAAAVDRALHGRLARAVRQTLAAPVVAGPWPEAVSEVFVLPLDAASNQTLVFGLSPRLPFDDGYQTFLRQIGEHVVDARVRVQVESERRNLLEQAPVPTALMIGPDHVFEIANPLYRKMVGRDVVGKKYLDAFPELRDTALPGILDRVYRLGEPFVTNEMLVPLDRHGDGKVEDSFFKFNLEPIRNADGTVYGMMAIASEITEQVTARRTLEAAGRTKDEFLATMSHELRTPLNAILGWARILKDDRPDQPTVDKGIAVIERNAVSQARLVNDLLDVSRIISGKLRLTLERVDLSVAIRGAVEVVRPAAEAKRVRLVAEIDPDVGATIADPDRVQQIVWNLLSNAVRFTPGQGLVKVSARRAQSAIRIEVLDTGAGIPGEHLPHIFERFRQVDSSTTRAQGGLGLGLAIVRHLAEAHGGSVSAESAGPGQGATFTVVLPIRPVLVTEPDPRPKGPLGGAPAWSKISLVHVRALIVDDDPDALDLLRAVLERAGVSVTGASSAVQALDAHGPFDIIISDIGMPQMDGYALIRRIRSRDVGADVPAIALTAYARAEDAEQARRSGYQEHLTKPVDIHRLLEAVKRWTGLHPARADESPA